MAQKPESIEWNEDNKTYLLTHPIQDAQKKWPNHKLESLKAARRRFRAQIPGLRKVPKINPTRIKLGVMPSPQKARILIYDIETSYLVGKVWGMYDQNVIGGYSGLLSDYQILTVAWTWYDPEKDKLKHVVHVKGQDDFPNYKPGVNDDTEIVAFIHSLYGEADIVIAHNGNQFDQKKCRARMVIRGHQPPAPNIEIDTKRMAKAVGGFTSNKLSDLAIMFGEELKADPGGIKTWDGCLSGDPKAWKHMKWYNKHDIPPLVGIYKKLLPWVKNMPGLNLINNDMEACPKCGGHNLTRQGRRKYNKTTTYQRVQCKDCSGWSQQRTAEKTTQKVLFTN